MEKPLNDALHAEIRFGLGPRLDQPAPSSPKAWLKDQVKAPLPQSVLLKDWDRMPTTEDTFRLWNEDDAARKQQQPDNRTRELYNLEAIAYAQQCVLSDSPFQERLVSFFANHLTVAGSGGFGASGFMVGAFIREAIRPHVTGRFADMVVASTRHPAMLLYLNQAASIGPDSPVGKRYRRGLNENLGREVMELHTVTPASGYSQDDVTAFAKLLTGLTVRRNKEPFGTVFFPDRHEPGPKHVMGRDWPEGEASIEASLRFLADHPAAQRNLAFKLARHFVADEPEPATVEKLFTVLRDTRGDLQATAIALVDLPEAWERPLAKLRAPQEFIIACFRAMGAKENVGNAVRVLSDRLGQGIWRAPQANGWPDTAAAWAAPEGLLQRFDAAYMIAGRYAERDLDEVTQKALGDFARDETRLAASRAGSKRDALTLILGSPEFQKR